MAPQIMRAQTKREIKSRKSPYTSNANNTTPPQRASEVQMNQPHMEKQSHTSILLAVDFNEEPADTQKSPSPRDESCEPQCNDCGGRFHIMNDPASQYNGNGIVCSNCKRSGAKELFGDDFFYQCGDCGMTDLCSKCHVKCLMLFFFSFPILLLLV